MCVNQRALEKPARAAPRVGGVELDLWGFSNFRLTQPDRNVAISAFQVIAEKYHNRMSRCVSQALPSRHGGVSWLRNIRQDSGKVALGIPAGARAKDDYPTMVFA